ncbi:3'-5' exoribonuclease YhaM family protein [Anaerovorax sp. IOR16]|uniref:3'-5' exoribonuclease YhaM family protein n=1 Tax=Anaerovorax sp. IOR16 TaxID=2773458 RepID=UPI0019D0A778|nr:HD domain-containing protein [Anaerovorax sp. IOR16]
MKERYIIELRAEEELQDFFLVKSLAIKIGSNKKQYLDLLLADNTGEITAKKWDVADTELPSLNEIKDGDIVKVKANVTEWNGMKQLRVLRIRKAVAQDQVDLIQFIKAAPEKAEDMFAYIMDAVEKMKDIDLKKLCTRILRDNHEKLLYYPAASKNHHAELAGLLYHTKRMLDMGERACLVYTNLKRDWVVAGVVLHDMEKINEIDANELGVASGYSFEGQMLGHLVQGIKTVDRLAREQGMEREKAILLEHMILTHHYEPEFGSPKKPLFPEAEILHYLDMLDARMYDMQEALNGVEPGGFSDRIWTLDNRKLYKPLEEEGEAKHD